MTVQQMHSFLTVTSARTNRSKGLGRFEREQFINQSILASKLGGPRVGLRQKGQIDWSKLERQNPYFQQTQPQENNKFNWKEGGKGALTGALSGAAAGAAICPPWGAIVGAVGGALIGLFAGGRSKG